MKRILAYGMTDNPGGIESYLLSIVEKAQHKGIQLDFVTDFPTIAYEEILKKNNASIYHIPAKGEKLWKHIMELYRILKKHPEYKTVYFNILDAGAAISMIVPHILRRKVVTHSHNGNTDKKKLHLLCRPLLNYVTDEYVACSKLAARFMFGEKVLEKKDVLIVPNAVDVEKYSYSEKIRIDYRNKLNIQDKLVICHVGRITRQKNPFRVIDIFEEICKRKKESVLLYVGSGDLEEDIRKYVKEKNIEDKVLFLGRRKDVSELMQASDVFLLPSLYEGLPIVAIEAQAVGLPAVLSSNITEETNVSGTIRFIDLEKSNSEWGASIINEAGRERKSNIIQIEEAGYSKNSNNDRISKLIDMM